MTVEEHENKLQNAVTIRQQYEAQTSELGHLVDDCQQKLDNANNLTMPVPQKLHQYQVGDNTV